jgi:hypothetical protein
MQFIADDKKIQDWLNANPDVWEQFIKEYPEYSYTTFDKAIFFTEEMSENSDYSMATFVGFEPRIKTSDGWFLSDCFLDFCKRRWDD